MFSLETTLRFFKKGAPWRKTINYRFPGFFSGHDFIPRMLFIKKSR